jgi:Uncharacterized conserved protein
MERSIKVSEESYNSISAGFKSIEIVAKNDVTQEIADGDILILSTVEYPNRVIRKTVAETKPISDFDKFYGILPLLRCGYTPFTLEKASTNDLLKRFGITAHHKTDMVCIEFEEEPLQRFTVGQSGVMPDCSSYDVALSEIRNGRKETHWIWYIFPQIKGLTSDIVTEYFALKSVDEAKSYIEHAVLGNRLKKLTDELLKLDTNDPVSIFGMGDSFKLRACMTLFSAIAPEIELFQNVIDKYCMGVRDKYTDTIIIKDIKSNCSGR